MQKFIAVRKEDAGEYSCRAKNDAGYSEYDIDVVGIVLGVLVVVMVLVCITAGICCAYKRGYFSGQKPTGNNRYPSPMPTLSLCCVSCSYKVPAKGDGVDYVRTEDEPTCSERSARPTLAAQVCQRSDPAQNVCGESWHLVGNSCLKFLTAKDSYDNAKLACRSHNAVLASLTTQKEVDFALKELQIMSVARRSAAITPLLLDSPGFFRLLILRQICAEIP
ncbi:Attractin [Liparis tanakae]|uniref:Attractin n=1 Tax=Liparis tanakae TaxID=230148 RepID=A0A4Z2IFV9_9TELE|nr:Attractin [Liparis tanakae]